MDAEQIEHSMSSGVHVVQLSITSHCIPHTVTDHTSRIIETNRCAVDMAACSLQQPFTITSNSSSQRYRQKFSKS